MYLTERLCIRMFFVFVWTAGLSPSLVLAQQGSLAADPLGYRSTGALAVERIRPPDAQPAPRGPLTWQPLGPFGGDVEDINFSPINPSIVLAGLAPTFGSGTLYRSTDSGATWARREPGGPERI